MTTPSHAPAAAPPVPLPQAPAAELILYPADEADLHRIVELARAVCQGGQLERPADGALALRLRQGQLSDASWRAALRRILEVA